MKEILTYTYQQVVNNWPTIIAFIGGSAGLSVLLQLIKKKLNLDEAKKIVITLLALFSYISAGAQYLISNSATSPLPTVLGNGSKLLALAVIIHRFAVSPSYAKLESYFTPLFAAAAQLRAETSEAVTVAPDVPSEVTVPS
jgi:hypothetical protein